MKRRWQIILPIVGLLLFGIQTRASVQQMKYAKGQSRYFWWSKLQLDSEPLKPPVVNPSTCKPLEECVGWDEQSIWRKSSPVSNLLVLTAFPAFILGISLVHVMGQLGVSEIKSFFILMPLLLASWYFFVGWLMDRRRYQRSAS